MLSTFSNVSERPVRVFIPFVSADTSKSLIVQLFSDRLLGKINSIQLHDKKLDVKPHLTIEERVERGFNIIPSKSIPDYKPAEQPTTTCENHNPIGMFNNDREREDILNDYNSIEQDMAIERESFQEWCMWTSPTFV